MARRAGGRRAQYGSPLGILLFLLPGLGTYTVLMLYPSVLSLYYSLLDWNGGPLSRAPFVGLANFQQMLGDPYLPGALLNNARVLFLSWAFQLPLALLLAFAITRLRRGGSVYRFLFFIPVIIPAATMALLWGFVFSGEPYGQLNALLRALGLGGLIRYWLSADGIVQWVTSFPVAFVGVGFYMIVFIAALVGIPQEYYEAAAIDGAGSWRQLRHITLPSIRGIYVAGMILALQGSLGAFIYPYLMLQINQNSAMASLHTADTPISYSLYLLYNQQEWGYGSAINVLVFALSGLAVALVWRFGRRPMES
jgi:raffinose/stachyose/melibiose transport system permease protein